MEAVMAALSTIRFQKPVALVSDVLFHCLWHFLLPNETGCTPGGSTMAMPTCVLSEEGHLRPASRTGE